MTQKLSQPTEIPAQPDPDYVPAQECNEVMPAEVRAALITLRIRVRAFAELAAFVRDCGPRMGATNEGEYRVKEDDDYPPAVLRARNKALVEALEGMGRLAAQLSFTSEPSRE